MDLIGEIMELLIQLETKEHVKHLGLSRKHLPLKQNTSLRIKDNFYNFHHSNLLIAIHQV